MNTMIQLLASAREADLQRAFLEQRMRNLVTACRRRLFGMLRPEQPCEPQSC